MDSTMSKGLQSYLETARTPSTNLAKILGSHQNKKLGISAERLKPIMPALREYISFWREYPDLFFDFLQTGGDPEAKKTFNLFFYQRIFLRVVMRYKYVYAVFPRAYSKSFLAILTLMLKCILYPRCELAVTSGGR